MFPQQRVAEKCESAFQYFGNRGKRILALLFVVGYSMADSAQDDR